MGEMAFMEKCGSNVIRANEGYGMGLSRSTSFGRKRVFLSSHTMEFGEDYDCIAKTSLKRRCSQDSISWGEKSAVEDLPQELLIKILCGVEHDDLKRLFFVSKAIREASLIAKQSHFAYSTPRKTVGFQNAEPFGELIEEIEAPNAPKQSRVPKHRLSAKKLSDLSVALFASGGDEEGWPRGDLFAEN